MSFDHGILNLANWAGNVILPTIAGLFIAVAILQFSKGADASHAVYGAFACLMASGLVRATETFASQRAWSDPDQYWVAVLTLVNWTCNVLLPVYAGLQVAVGAMSLATDHHFHPASKWMRHFATAALCLMVSGLLRLAEFFVSRGTGGIT
jgi:hypothetical protein